MNVEERLIKEAQLMRLKARDFNPYGGLLTVWRGVVYGRGRYRGLPFEIEIRIPPDFPKAPPKIYAITPMIHPAVTENGEIKLDILKKWNPSIHLYEVVNALKAEFALRPPVPKGFAPLPAPTGPVPPPPPVQTVSYVAPSPPPVKVASPSMTVPAAAPSTPGEDVSRLKELLRKKEEELQSLRKKIEQMMSSKEQPKTKEELKAERDALKVLLDNLEEKFLSGEIKLEDYAKLYKRYMRELYLVKRRLGEL